MINADFGTLFLIPTVLAPGTEAAVLTPQVREVLQRAPVLLAENLRTARRFLSRLSLGATIDDRTWHELSKRTPATEVPAMLEPLRQGQDVGVLSEAGCPGVADPGARAVTVAHGWGARVEPLVGPSSLLLALMGSGFSGQSFAFHGYLPVTSAERAQALRRLERTVAQTGQTQLFMETPYRNRALLAAVLQTCAPTTSLCVAANLTSPAALLRTATVAEWRNQAPDLHKVPAVFLLGRA